MNDKKFLEIFDKIDDKFLIETYKETEKLRRGSRKPFFHTVYTAAACIMVAAAVVLVVSSFLDRGGLVQPSSAGEASQSTSDISDNGSIPDSDSSDSDSSDNNTSEPLVYNNSFYFVDEPVLTFPDNYAEGLTETPDDKTSYFYAGSQQQQSVSATLTLTVKSNGDDIEKIPMRMFLFCNGQQSLFRYDKANIAYLDTNAVMNKQNTIDFSFYAGRLTGSAAVVCVFFPGDAARQSCVIRSACNLWWDAELDESRRIDFGMLGFDEPINNLPNILTLNKALHYDGFSAENILNKLVSENRECVSGSPVKTLSVDSAYIYAYYNVTDRYSEYLDVYGDYFANYFTLIALIDGEPAPVFDGEFSAQVRFENGGVNYSGISSEYLSENSTIQLIALPIRTNMYNWWGMSSECCLLTE